MQPYKRTSIGRLRQDVEFLNEILPPKKPEPVEKTVKRMSAQETRLRRKNERRRKRVVFVVGLFKKYRKLVRKAHSKRVHSNICSVLDLLSDSVLRQLSRQLRTSPNREAIAKALAKRVCFLPQKEFDKFCAFFRNSVKRGTEAISFRTILFINLGKIKRREGSLDTSITHEIGHVIVNLINVDRMVITPGETWPAALELIALSKGDKRSREKAVRIGRTRYIGKYDTVNYREGINRGRKVFRVWNEISQRSGENTANHFLQLLLKRDVMMDKHIEVAAEEAKQKST